MEKTCGGLVLNSARKNKLLRRFEQLPLLLGDFIGDFRLSFQG
jgi:hypothetical protein